MAELGRRAGFFASLQDVGATLVAMLQTRLELLGSEVEAEKLRLLRMLLLSQLVMFSAAMGTLLFVAMLTLWLWEQRLGVLALFCVLFAAAAVFAYRALMQMVNSGEPAFAATLSELQEDVRRLKTASGRAKAPD